MGFRWDVTLLFVVTFTFWLTFWLVLWFTFVSCHLTRCVLGYNLRNRLHHTRFCYLLITAVTVCAVSFILSEQIHYLPSVTSAAYHLFTHPYYTTYVDTIWIHFDSFWHSSDSLCHYLAIQYIAWQSIDYTFSCQFVCSSKYRWFTHIIYTNITVCTPLALFYLWRLFIYAPLSHQSLSVHDRHDNAYNRWKSTSTELAQASKMAQSENILRSSKFELQRLRREGL